MLHSAGLGTTQLRLPYNQTFKLYWDQTCTLPEKTKHLVSPSHARTFSSYEWPCLPGTDTYCPPSSPLRRPLEASRVRHLAQCTKPVEELNDYGIILPETSKSAWFQGWAVWYTRTHRRQRTQSCPERSVTQLLERRTCDPIHPFSRFSIESDGPASHALTLLAREPSRNYAVGHTYNTVACWAHSLGTTSVFIRDTYYLFGTMWHHIWQTLLIHHPSVVVHAFMCETLFRRDILACVKTLDSGHWHTLCSTALQNNATLLIHCLFWQAAALLHSPYATILRERASRVFRDLVLVNLVHQYHDASVAELYHCIHDSLTFYDLPEAKRVPITTVQLPFFSDSHLTLTLASCQYASAFWIWGHSDHMVWEGDLLYAAHRCCWSGDLWAIRTILQLPNGAMSPCTLYEVALSAEQWTVAWWLVFSGVRYGPYGLHQLTYTYNHLFPGPHMTSPPTQTLPRLRGVRGTSKRLLHRLAPFLGSTERPTMTTTCTDLRCGRDSLKEAQQYTLILLLVQLAFLPLDLFYNSRAPAPEHPTGALWGYATPTRLNFSHWMYKMSAREHRLTQFHRRQPDGTETLPYVGIRLSLNPWVLRSSGSSFSRHHLTEQDIYRTHTVWMLHRPMFTQYTNTPPSIHTGIWTWLAIPLKKFYSG